MSGGTAATGLTYQWQSAAPAPTPVYAPITGATASTYVATQTVATLYRCVVTCTASTLSAPSTPLSVGMNAPTACYCAMFPGNTADGDIGNVTFGTLNNGSATPVLSNPLAVNAYTNNTANPSIAIPTFVRGGAAVTITLSQITGLSTFYDSVFAVYIDYNQNGVFDEAAELAFSSIAATTATTATQTGSVTIPATALTGATRMRVVLAQQPTATPIAPSCNPFPGFGYGEVEDYTINITSPGCTATSVVVSPVSGPVTFTNGTAITNITLSASGTAGASYVYAISAGALPAGLTLAAGVISGTPTATGTGSFTVTATSTPGACTGTATYSFTVNAASACPTITFANTVATAATVGTAYTLNASATASSGTVGYTVLPALPASLTLNATTGQITGTPTAVTASASYVVTAATSGTCSATQSYTFAVACSAVVVTPVSGALALTAGTAITNITLGASGGVAGATYSYVVTSGSLPAGLTLAAGVISGTPTTTGTGTFTITATTAPSGCVGTATYTFTVAAAPCPTFTVSTAVPTVANVGTAYSLNGAATATSGTIAYTVSPALPAGLTLNAATGLISGTPTAITASATYNVVASTSATCSSPAKAFVIEVKANPATAIDNALGNLVKVSPNPSKGDFSVDFGTINMAKSSVRVYDAQGKVVFTSDKNTNLMVISLEKFANGFYLMEVETSKGRILKRLAKQ